MLLVQGPSLESRCSVQLTLTKIMQGLLWPLISASGCFFPKEQETPRAMELSERSLPTLGLCSPRCMPHGRVRVETSHPALKPLV